MKHKRVGFRLKGKKRGIVDRGTSKCKGSVSRTESPNPAKSELLWEKKKKRGKKPEFRT
jgi:hypothetical protein